MSRLQRFRQWSDKNRTLEFFNGDWSTTLVYACCTPLGLTAPIYVLLTTKIEEIQLEMGVALFLIFCAGIYAGWTTITRIRKRK